MNASTLLNRTKRSVRWFVRGRHPNGARWESVHRHPTREGATAELVWWAAHTTDAGEMKVSCEIARRTKESRTDQTNEP